MYPPARKIAAAFLTILLAALIYPMFGCQSGHATSANQATNLHLDPFVVNLADIDGRSFLRVGIDLSMGRVSSSGQSPERNAESVAVMRDSIISLLSTRKSDDLLTPEGKKKLKQDLINTLNKELPDLKVQEVYFNEFMVQH